MSANETLDSGYLQDLKNRQQDYLNWAGDIRKTMDKLQLEATHE